MTPLPSGSTVTMAGPLSAPNELDEKTIRVPSGDQAGSTELGTTRRCPLPSEFMTQTELPLP